MSTYYQPSRYHWDTAAQAAYLSIDNTGSSTDRFISYDDVRTCQAKVSFARNRGLGGIMIWELAQDHIANQTDPLLAAIKTAMATPGAVTIQPVGAQNIEITFSAIPLGSYRLQWSTNLATQIWNTLLVTNIPNTSTGGLVRVQDVLPSSTRFYRVKTPP